LKSNLFSLKPSQRIPGFGWTLLVSGWKPSQNHQKFWLKSLFSLKPPSPVLWHFTMLLGSTARSFAGLPTCPLSLDEVRRRYGIMGRKWESS
jgi:hypothetical protein